MPVATLGSQNGLRRIALRNILLATDFSTPSETALDYAAALARNYDARLFIAHVLRPTLREAISPDQLAAMETLSRRHAEQQIASILVSGMLRDIPHQVLLGEGELWSELSAMLGAHEVDLIVVGTHGRTGVRKLLLGSAAEQIFRMAPCPVLTVGPHVPAAPDPGSGRSRRIQHVLYATDFSPHSERAVAYALSVAQEHMAHLTMVHVVKESSELSDTSTERLNEMFRRRLRELVPLEAELWCEPEFVVKFGLPAETILELSHGSPQHPACDLIVLGVRRAATFPGHLPPATAYRVVCQAACPVLTVRG